ncbi:MAG: FimV/HubP family polar landmark protein [Burkholderiales bacterium]
MSLVAAALALPPAVHALGLGRLAVESYVGQPLVARIELLSTSKEELDTLSAKIADPSLYRQNNLTYQGVLSRARISLERGPGDTAYLRVTSSQPVTEPYLDLLVEANWASGRVVRDYTFLLDPPGTTTPPVDPITPLRAGAAPAPRAAAPAAAPSAPATRAAAAPAAPRGQGDSYEVKRGDTLSKIAQNYKPDTVTLDQMLVALFKSNANAFDGGNMNRLRTGAIITIPNAADAAAASATEATRTVQVQASDWRSYRDRVAGAAPLAEESSTRAAGGRIGTAVQESTPAVRPGSDQLKVSREAGVAKGGGAAAAAETNAAQAAQLRDAQSRIADLEKTLKDLQRAVEMKNQTLAQAQTQAELAKGKAPAPAAAPAVAPPPPPVAKAPEPPKAAAPAPVPPKAAEPAKAEPPKAAEPAKAEPPKAAEPAKVEPPKAAESAKVEAPKAPEPTKTEPPKVEPPKAEPPKVEPPKPTPPKTVAKAPAKEPPGFFEELLSNVPGWGIGAVLLALLGGLVALFAARRRKTTKFEDSIISGTDIKTNTVFGSTGGGVVNTGDNSLASDFSREGLGNIDTDEVDPIAEAEVYLAYGRDAQAEEILKDALKKDPQRQEIYLKLLEIHAQHNKPSAFETVASELYSVTNGQGEVWQKAVVLGRQLDPANPLFAEGGAPAPKPAGEAAAASVASLEAALPSDIGGDRNLEFQMDEEISISPSSGAAPKSPADILAGAESELEKTAKLSVADIDTDRTLSLGAGAGAAIAGAIAASKAAEEPPITAQSFAEKVESTKDRVPEAAKFDLDFQLDEAEKPAPFAKPRPPEPEPVLEAAGAAAPSLTRPAAALELDKLDLSFDPERSTFEDPTPSVLDGQWHDAATKLDLAKAYQEMGDVEGAREILQEVLHEGDDQQKAEAKALLGKLG